MQRIILIPLNIIIPVLLMRVAWQRPDGELKERA